MAIDLGFDEEALMIKHHTGSAQEIYHTKLADADVHSISNSSAYAANQIINEKNYELGLKIFKKVISLQDTDKDSATYGLWPWYAEEPLHEMDAPDYNMAGFNAKEMIVSIYEEGTHFDEETKNAMLNSIAMACECIMKRNMGCQYTNVCITDCFITAAAGELTGIYKYTDYGNKKLKKFLEYTHCHGSVNEYNSPAYSILAINDIGDFLKYIKNETTLMYANEINHILWEMIAAHFDYNTLQLNGPQERAYSDYAGIDLLKTIGHGAGIDFTSHPKFLTYYKEEDKKNYHKKSRLTPVCPDDLVPYFNGKKEVKYIQKIVTPGYNYPYFEFPKAITAYRGDDYTVGTSVRSELWHQRHPFQAYIYTDEKDVCMRVRCLHDGFDFSSGVFHSIQHKSNILAGINFSENRGDTHVNLDMISDGKVWAKDLRICFEFTNCVDRISFSEKNGKIIFNVNGKIIRLNPFIKEFGDFEVVEEATTKNNTFRYSFILYNGENKLLELCSLKKALLAFTVEFEPEEEYNSVTINENGDLINAEWKPADTVLSLTMPCKTLPFIRNMSEDKMELDGKDLFDILTSQL